MDTGIRALLRSGRVTVRQFLSEAYGCFLGPREYATLSHLTPGEADAREFLRILGRYAGARKRQARVM